MSLLALPDQTIPESKKDKDWHIAHALNYATYSLSSSHDDQKKLMLKYYRAYNAELSDEEAKLAKRITCPHGTDLGIEYIVYPLIQGKIEQMIGEFTLRPLKNKAYVMDKESKNQKFEEKLKLLSEEIMRELTEKLQPDLGFTPQTENMELPLPDDVEDFFESDFKTIGERVADGILKIFLDVMGEKKKLKEALLHYCITDRAHVVLEKKHGHPCMRHVHPLDADYDIDPYCVVQDNHEYFFENLYLSENEIYNSFPQLTKDEKEIVKSTFQSIGDDNLSSEDSENLTTAQTSEGWYQTNNKVSKLRIISAMWKSRKRVTIKENTNKDGVEFVKKVDEDYKPKKTDKLTHIDGEQPRHVMMIGPNLCLSYGVMDQRYSNIEEPWFCTLPVVSIIRDNTSGSSYIKSVAAKLYQLQEMASEVLFEIRLALKSAGDSRVLVYDVAQTPKAFTKAGFENGLNRVMTHIKKDKLLFINSREKGFQKNSFNQFTSLDLSQKGGVQDLFNGLAIIEDLADKFTGMSPERQGNVGQYQTASGTDKAIRQSAARTEVIYGPFDEFIEAVLKKVILKAKHDYAEGEVVQYIIGEMKTKFLTILKDFFISDYGIYLGDTRRDKESAETINRATEMLLSNAQDPMTILGAIDVLEKETAVEKKAVFTRMIKAMEEARQQRAEQEQKMNQEQIQAEAKAKEEDRGLTREGHDKDIEVAEIYANSKSASDTGKNLTAERIAAAKIMSDAEKEKNKDKSQSNTN